MQDACDTRVIVAKDDLVDAQRLLIELLGKLEAMEPLVMAAHNVLQVACIEKRSLLKER